MALLCASASHAAELGTLGLSYVRTDDVLLVHDEPELTPLVPHAASTFRNALDWQRRVFGWIPSDRTTLWLRDLSDNGNARVTPAPRNLYQMDVAPMASPFETAPSAERMYSMMNHELVHLGTSDVANSRDRFWRRVFLGKVSPQPQHPESLLYTMLTVPRWAAPRWQLEGAAVFLETWMGGGQGRAQGGYDEMVFRAMVRDGAPFYDPLALETRGTRSDFQSGANAYLYGTRFLTWLAWAKSPQQVLQWLRRDEGSQPDYAAQFAQVFELPLNDAWKQWIADERRFQQANLDALRQHPPTPLRPLSGALGSVSRAFVDEEAGTLITAVRTRGVVDHIAEINMRTGAARTLAEVQGATMYDVTSLAWDAKHKRVFFTTDNQGLRSLWAVEADTGERTALLTEARIGELAFDPSTGSLLGVRHEAGLASLVRIPYPYRDWQTLYTFDYGTVPRDLDVSPDGTQLVASVSDPGGDQFVQVFDMGRLREGNAEPAARFSFGQAAPEGFVFSPDGRHLYGSAYYTGVSNIFRIELATARIDAVSNAETGLFRPTPRPDGTLVAFEYTGPGFRPVALQPQTVAALGTIRLLGAEVAQRHPVVKTWQVPAARTEDLESLVRQRGAYHSAEHLQLNNAFPVLFGYREAGGLGWCANFADPLTLTEIGLLAAVTPGQGLRAGERLHLEATARHLGWSASLAWNKGSFYDLFGPTLRGTRGFQATLGRDVMLLYQSTQRLELRNKLAWYTGLETLPGAQNVAAGGSRLLLAETGLYYSDLRRSLGAVGDEKGVSASAALTLSRTAGRVVTQPLLRLDAGMPLGGWRHASLWSRTAAGGTAGTDTLAVSRHYFGAFGNNWVDDGTVQRYREPGSLPGFKIDEVSARSYVRQMVELNLPPMVFQSLGRPDLYLQSLRPAVFAAGLWTEPFVGDRRRYASLGAQVDLRISVLHWYDMTLSLGGAVGWKGKQRAGTEWMLSLKVL
ncbi:YncE family protein [Roseateles cellulosilyticus]|uniref:Uncharacterized protein n=1 Tax=Pelomonas cellulosilytica TaxID=2906762 RepID=A0ABS8XVA3_9BURK|nr:hypothetical protein [Pelomonas sp. P8]MCE4554653.1 hypothetical protein [Pelomonas sp. P8]